MRSTAGDLATSPSRIAPAPSRDSPTPSSGADEDAFGVYVHWPFCAAKCPYCDFNSHVRREPPDEARFVRAFETEIAHTRALTGPRRATSVFFGGGTPSLMAPETVGAILRAVDGAWGAAPGAEVTLEANPSSVEAARFRGYRSAGVNRVSLGVQALNDGSLRRLGRLHDAAQALAALTVARDTFERVSFDLIYARPGQALEDWRAELRRALSFEPDHLSLYQLTIEPGTPFERLHATGRLAVPDPELAADFFELTGAVASRAGLPRYEVSNHARPGAESRHNLVYWRYQPYAGIGPGAHGRLPVDGERIATIAEPTPEAWMSRVERDGHGMIETETLAREKQADEMLLMGLRLAEGLRLSRHAALKGAPLAPGVVDPLIAEGLLERPAPDRLRATERGVLLVNALAAELAA